MSGARGWIGGVIVGTDTTIQQPIETILHNLLYNLLILLTSYHTNAYVALGTPFPVDTKG